MDVHIEHLNLMNNKFKIFEYIDNDLIRDKARQIQNNLINNKFDIANGLFVSVKDIFNTMEMPTKMGKLGKILILVLIVELFLNLEKKVI